MIFGGIDPGKSGALAIIDSEGRSVLARVPMPVIKGGRRDEYDIARIRTILLTWRDAQLFVTLEKLQPMPRAQGGGITNFLRGASLGFAWMLTALEIPHHLVSPQTWQKRMLEGTPGDDTKQRAIIAAQRLFPGLDLRRTEKSIKPDDGIADALLLAEYGRRGRL